MAGNAVIIDSKHHNDWIVPRRVMCAFFWIGIILLFTGIILLVTSKHKGELYQSWGAILLGLGFCLLLICLILCLHAYCVITITDDELPVKTNIPPPPPPSTVHDNRGSLEYLDEEPDDIENDDDNPPPGVVFDLGASSPPQTPDALDGDNYEHSRFISKSASAPQVPIANGDVARRQKGSSQPAALGSWRNQSGRSLRNAPQNQAPATNDGPKPSSRVGSPYYVEDPVSRVQTPFGSSHALTPLHMIDTETPKASTTSRLPPEIHDGTHYQGMGSYDNAQLSTKTPTNYSTSASKAELPYDNCEKPTVADAAELIRVRAQEATNGIYEGTGSARGTPSSIKRNLTGGSTPVSRRGTPASPRIAQGSPRGTPTSVRAASASPRGTPASAIESRSVTPGSTRGTPVVVDDDVSTTREFLLDDSSDTVSEKTVKTSKYQTADEKDSQVTPSPATHGGTRIRPPMLLTRQVPIPEGSESDDFEDKEVENNLPEGKAPPTSRASTGPMGRGSYFLPPGYRPLGAMSPAPRSAFTSVPPSDMRLYHPRPQRYPPSGERILNFPPGMRPPFGVPSEPRRFSQPVVVYLNPNMQQSDSKVSVYDNVQYVWSDQNPHHYQPYTEGDKTYCDV